MWQHIDRFCQILPDVIQILRLHWSALAQTAESDLIYLDYAAVDTLWLCQNSEM